MKSGQRSALALKGCVRPACMVVASGQQKSPGARFARAAWRSFDEYAFLEDSRYASQLKSVAQRIIRLADVTGDVERRSIQPARFFGQHDRDAVADRIGELGGARDQLLLLRIVFERALGQRADQNFQELRIDAAGGALGRGGHDALQTAGGLRRRRAPGPLRDENRVTRGNASSAIARRRVRYRRKLGRRAG